MAILNFNKKSKNKRDVQVTLENPVTARDLALWSDPVVRQKYQVAKAMLGMSRNGFYGFSVAYNGEKDLGGIGPLIDYFVDYEGFRARSWKAYLDSEIAQTVIGRFKLWTIGNGLKLNSEPISEVLEPIGISLSEQDFNDMAEARFQLYANSTISDYSGMKTLHENAGTAFINGKVGGDVLCILRYIDDQVKVQLIDGVHIQNPIGSSPYIALIGNAGNILKNGIEIDPRGRHIAYYVRKRGLNNNGTNDLIIDFESERIPAFSESTGLDTAFFITGLDYRLDNVRCLPLIAAVMQTMTTMERYKEATLQSAEEAAKIVLAVEHDIFSNEDDPFADVIRHARGTNNSDKIPVDDNGQQLADKIAVTTNKQVFNMGRGQHLKAFTGEKEIYFKDFYTINIECVCATVGIPYAVAMSKYDTSYSSSRAAIKDWEHTLNVTRKQFATQFYQKIYNFWLHTEILKGNIKAPGYLEAFFNNDYAVLAAYRHARFVGAAVPHIDPVKEVEAQRLLLGDTAASIPLTTVEAATEALNNGEADSNMEQYSKELDKSKKLNIKVELSPVITPALPNKKKKSKV